MYANRAPSLRLLKQQQQRRTFSRSSLLATSRSSTSPSSRAHDSPACAEPVEEQRPVSAAAFIAAQAAAEEEQDEPKKQKVVPDPDAWDGEESRERMVRRILEDSYKPLRVKDYKKPIPQPSPLPSQLFTSPPSSTTEAEAPPRPLHPWEVEFKAPDHYNPAPGYRARIPLRSGPAATSAAAKARQAAQRAGGARKARLASAYEASLDYRGGVRPSEIKAERDKEGEEHANDAGMLGPMSGWSGIVENRILQAKREGLFRNIRGRGKPLPKDDAESNPFISRSEFLINRIMKEQDTAPPWVEMQKELELALSTWRTNLRASWSRRAIRIRSSEGLTPAVIREVKEGWMDPEWEARERAYHDAALHDVNQLVRKYNVIAPYHVRRPLLTLRSELDTAISGSASHIAAELQRRLDLGLNTTPAKVIYQDEGGEDGVKSVTAEEMGGERKAVKESMWQGFRRLVVEVLAQPPDPVGQAARPGSGSGR